MNEIVPQSTGTEVDVALPTGYGENASLAVSLARAEVDQQIATARALPRNLSRVVKNILTLATMDERSAEECIYALPRGGKPIKGPSIRLAEIINSQWGNCRVGARVVHVDRFEKYIEAEGVFHDLETNTATTARVRRRISDKNGKVLNEDMIVVTGNAACSIAKRNAILGGVPKAVWRKAYEAVEKVIAGDAKTLVVRRTEAMKAFAAFGVKPEQICEALSVGGVESIGLDHMATLIGMHSSLKSGESTVEEMFPKVEKQAGGAKGLGAALDKLAAKGAEAKEPAKDGKKEPEPGPKKADLPPHDPETGEIKDDPPQAKEEADQADDAAAQDAEDTLLDKARTAALRGKVSFLGWHGKLTQAEADELAPEFAKLKRAAEAVDRERADEVPK